MMIDTSDIPNGTQEVVIGGNGSDISFSQRVLAIACSLLLPESRGGPRDSSKQKYLQGGFWTPLTVQIVRQGMTTEHEFLGKLIEDKFSFDMSYISYLVQPYKDIQDMMTGE